MNLPKGQTRLDLVREGLTGDTNITKRGRLIVSISKLKEDPKNERKTFRKMDGLIASMKAVGLIEPITVTPEPDGRYKIVTGHRRYRAAKAAGLDQVEILIREPKDERKRRQKSVISNVQREDGGPVEMAEALQAMMDEDDRIHSQEDLAEVIGNAVAALSTRRSCPRRAICALVSQRITTEAQGQHANSFETSTSFFVECLHDTASDIPKALAKCLSRHSQNSGRF